MYNVFVHYSLHVLCAYYNRKAYLMKWKIMVELKASREHETNYYNESE